MPVRSTIELRDLLLETDIGSYGPGQTIPKAHILDLVLTIDPTLVLIGQDGMDNVFDYDPLIEVIGHLSSECHYETQERLITRICQACANYPEIEAVDIMLSKTPVLNETGKLGVRVSISAAQIHQLRLEP